MYLKRYLLYNISVPSYITKYKSYTLRPRSTPYFRRKADKINLLSASEETSLMQPYDIAKMPSHV